MLTLFLTLLTPAFAGPILPTAAVVDDDDDAEDAGDDVARSFDEIADELELSADQRTKLSKLVFDYRTAKIDSRAKLAKARLTLRQALVSETLDEKTAQKALDDVSSASTELQRAKVKLVIEMRKIVTYQQFQELMELREDRRDERKERRSKG